MSRLAQLREHGQSFWLDSLSRRMLDDGTLARRIEEQGLSGITSNPAIFAKAMGDSPDYDERLRVALESTADPEALYVTLAVDDVRDACDLLLPTYEASDAADGFVSLEVSPYFAYDPVATIREARELWGRVGRPNLFIKVPGTAPGLHAVEVLLYDGINVNITLLFGLDAYREAQQAHLRAMQRRLEAGRDLRSVTSVASFFLSRIDVAVDGELRQRLSPQVDERIRTKAEDLLGRSALANAQLAYAELCQVLSSERWQRLAEAGAHPQRLVWASTGTKEPSYSDVLYIEPLIGPNTVSTMPEATAAAFEDHGRVARTLTEEVQSAPEVMGRLKQLSVDFGAVTQQLIGEGVQKFIDPYQALLERLAGRAARLGRAEHWQAPPIDFEPRSLE